MATTLRLVNGGIQALDGIDSVEHRVRHHLRWFHGEWFLAPDGGVRYLSILGRQLAPEIIGSILAQQAATLEDVDAVQVLGVSQDATDLEVSLQVESRFGIFQITVPVAA